MEILRAAGCSRSEGNGILWQNCLLRESDLRESLGRTMHRLRSLLCALKPTRLGVLFAVLIGLGVGFWQWSRPPRPRVVLENLGIGTSADFSPDGRTLAVVHTEHYVAYFVSLWDTESGHERFELIKGEWRRRLDGEEQEWPLQVLFSPDGDELACRFRSQIRVWKVASGEELVTYDERYWPMVYSTEGKLLYLSDYILHDVRDNKVVKKLLQHGETMLGCGDKAIWVRGTGNRTKIWNLETGNLVAQRDDIPIPRQDFGPGFPRPLRIADLSPDHRFLIYQVPVVHEGFIFDLLTGESHKLEADLEGRLMFATMATDGKTMALGIWQPVESSVNNSWWSSFLSQLGIQSHRSFNVILKAFPSNKEIITLPDCRNPQFSPDGQTLLVSTGQDGTTLQLYDLPIRKPIGKILVLAGLAAVATLLAINGLGRLRRRKCSGQPVDSPASQPSPGTDHDRLEHQAQ